MTEHVDVSGYREVFGEPFWKEKPRFTVHAFVTGVTELPEGIEITIELTEADSFSGLVERFPDDAPTLFRHALTSPATLTLNRRDHQKAGSPRLAQEGDWITLELDRDKPSDTEIRLLETFADPVGTPFYVQNAVQTPASVVAAHAMPIGRFATAAMIVSQLRRVQTANLQIALLDVGQGAAAYLFSDAPMFPWPLLYFDLGGAVAKNAHTNPVGGVHWCFGAAPPVFLSHWHWDHYAGATYGGALNVAKAVGATWIGPARATGGHCNKFKAQILAAGGNILLWPTTLPPITHGAITVGLSVGASCNDSGLVLMLESPKGRYSLMPGDASYQFIDATMVAMFGEGLRTLIATHHCGKFSGSYVPPPDGQKGNLAVFSAGPGNSYGHPSALAAHTAVAWPTPIGTDQRLGLPVRHRKAATGGVSASIHAPRCGGSGPPDCSLRLHK